MSPRGPRASYLSTLNPSDYTSAQWRTIARAIDAGVDEHDAARLVLRAEQIGGYDYIAARHASWPRWTRRAVADHLEYRAREIRRELARAHVSTFRELCACPSTGRFDDDFDLPWRTFAAENFAARSA